MFPKSAILAAIFLTGSLVSAVAQTPPIDAVSDSAAAAYVTRSQRTSRINGKPPTAGPVQATSALPTGAPLIRASADSAA